MYSLKGRGKLTSQGSVTISDLGRPISQSPPDNSSRFGYLVQTDQRVRNIRPSLNLNPWSSLTSQPLSSIYQGGDLILDEAQRCGVYFSIMYFHEVCTYREKNTF